MIKTFYSVVTQYDCDPNGKHCSAEDPAEGPIMMETYLNEEHANKAYVERLAAERFNTYGWARVATITIDIPE